MTEFTHFSVVVPDNLKNFDLEVFIQHAIDNIDEASIVDVMDFITNHNDIFMRSYIGYWAFGVKHYADEGWLVFDEAGSGVEVGNTDAIIAAWEEGAPHAHSNDIHMFDKKFAFQVALNLRNIHDWDATDIDNAIQKTLFGRVEYG